jgi:uncharacterized protein with PIN domain
MVVDTSAFIAILDEPDGPDYLEVLIVARRLAVSALTLYETRIVLSGRRDGRRRFKEGAEDQLAVLLAGLQAEIVPFTEAQAVLAHQTYLKFGRGFHPAHSISATAQPMPWPSSAVNHCSSRARTSPGQMSSRRSPVEPFLTAPQGVVHPWSRSGAAAQPPECTT